MVETLGRALQHLPDSLEVIILSMVPVVELRGAIPWAALRGMNPVEGFLLSVFGNLIPIVPVLLLLEPVSRRLRKVGVMARFFDWLFERTKRHAGVVEKYEAIGLAIFVAVPLPGTGAWSGCIAASLFGIRPRYAMPAIALGVVGAGIIVAVLVAAGTWVIAKV